MNEYVKDSMLTIAEKNMILETLEINVDVRCYEDFKFTFELDKLLYKSYKSIMNELFEKLNKNEVLDNEK